MSNALDNTRGEASVDRALVFGALKMGGSVREWKVERRAFAQSVVTWKGREVGTVGECFFQFPERDVVGTLLNQWKGVWWTPLREVSVASDPEGEKVVDGGVERAEHDRLVSGTFALHPMFGPGHVVRTNGQIAAFWDGVECWVVECGNLERLAVRLDQRTAAKPTRASRARETSRVLVEKVFADLLG